MLPVVFAYVGDSNRLRYQRQPVIGPPLIDPMLRMQGGTLPPPGPSNINSNQAPFYVSKAHYQHVEFTNIINIFNIYFFVQITEKLKLKIMGYCKN